MQAIVETLFDAVYLLSVITIGILIPRAFALCNTGLENYTVSLGLGKWITSVTMTIFYVLLYYVWRQRYKINGKGVLTAAVYGLAGVRIGLCMDAPKPVAPFQIFHLLGRLPQYSVRPAGISGHCAVLSQCKKFRGSGVSPDVADHCPELWLLYSGGAVGGCVSPDRDADDPQDLRLCMDGTDRIFCYETGM